MKRVVLAVCLAVSSVAVSAAAPPSDGLDFPIDRLKVMAAAQAGLRAAVGDIAATYASDPDVLESVAVEGCDGKPYRYVVAGFHSLRNPALRVFTILEAEGADYRHVHTTATDGPPAMVTEAVRHPEADESMGLAGCGGDDQEDGWELE